MYAIRYRLREAWEFCKRILRPIWNLTRWAAIAAVLALFYQAIATAMQAEALAWDTLGSPSSVGHLGKVNALKHLNKDSTFPIPAVARLFGLEEGEEYWFGRVDDRQTFRMPGPLYFRGRTNLQGIDLSLGNSFKAGCPEQPNVLQGLKMGDAMLSLANFECADFVGPGPSRGILLHNSGRLVGADFTGARLQNAKFSGATLDFSALTSAELQGAEFYGASLVGVKFDGANADGAKFKGVSVDPRKLPRHVTQLPSFPNCPNANVCFVAACLRYAEMDFRPSWRPISIDFRGAVLSNAKIQGQIITARFGRLREDENGEKVEQDLNPSLMRRVFDYFGYSNAADVKACIASANVMSARRRSTTVEGQPQNPSLRAADLSGAELTDVVWKETDFKGASLDGAWLMGADLRDAKFDGATQLSKACIDDFTILPEGITRPSRVQTDARCPSSTPVVEGSLQKQSRGAFVIPDKFVGRVVAFKKGAFQIAVGDEQLEFVDVSVQMGLNSFGAFGAGERMRVEEHLAQWVGNTPQDIRCVSFPLKTPPSDDSSDPQDDISDPQEESAQSKDKSSRTTLAAANATDKDTTLRVRSTRYGWCALPDEKNRNVSRYRFSDVVLEEAHKVLNTEKAITPASNTQGQRTP
jgi:uncharacterized protein YjbI with pentapeptide repeats